MDIPALSMEMASSRIGTQISFAVMSKVMDTVEETSEAFMEMMEAAAPAVPTPGLGEFVDIMV